MFVTMNQSLFPTDQNTDLFHFNNMLTFLGPTCNFKFNKLLTVMGNSMKTVRRKQKAKLL